MTRGEILRNAIDAIGMMAVMNNKDGITVMADQYSLLKTALEGELNASTCGELMEVIV